MTRVDLEAFYYRQLVPNGNSIDIQATNSDIDSELNSPEICYQQENHCKFPSEIADEAEILINERTCCVIARWVREGDSEGYP